MRLLNTKMHFLIAIQAISTQKGKRNFITKYTSNYYGLLLSNFNNILVEACYYRYGALPKYSKL